MRFALICFALIEAALAGFSPEGQAAIVKAHNELRSAVANGKYVAKDTPLGPANNMRKLSWDNDLAKYAQSYADTCPEGHLKGDKDYGENLYWAYSSAPMNELDPFGVKASQRWEGEFKEFGYLCDTYTKKTNEFGIGHATQMLWAETTLIGCGIKNCGKGGKKDMYTVAVVCRYRKPGNWINSNIYNKGEPCSKCPPGTKCEKETGLCV
ncbi:hypothetical protein CAEBREN_00080 [Caenorhabditis brenneri]|uniref:SCP domain-containing protein n=1 Tax=Caenorhabditis brenneri TaxID=135651 RepID=G0MRV4_CAEBE|nr:hypothetical protein CAEBREN_00080 [Caenorhabditis brenneri]